MNLIPNLSPLNGFAIRDKIDFTQLKNKSHLFYLLSCSYIHDYLNNPGAIINFKIGLTTH